MFGKLRANYKLSNVLVRIAVVLTYVLYSWQRVLATARLMTTMYDFAAGMSDTYMLVVSIFSAMLIGVAIMFLAPLIANVFLNVCRIYSVPRAEYGLIALVFLGLFYLVCGVLSLVNLITPIFLIWGERLFPFVAATGCLIGFYAVTKKLYFNDATAKYYFRNMAIVYFVVAFVFGVLL